MKIGNLNYEKGVLKSASLIIKNHKYLILDLKLLESLSQYLIIKETLSFYYSASYREASYETILKKDVKKYLGFFLDELDDSFISRDGHFSVVI